VANGEKVPSGKLRDDAIKAVLEHLWKQLEEDRVEKLAKKAAGAAAEADKPIDKPMDWRERLDLIGKARELEGALELMGPSGDTSNLVCPKSFLRAEPANIDTGGPQTSLVAQAKAGLLMASDEENFRFSLECKLMEFQELGYPRAMRRAACKPLRMYARSQNRRWLHTN
jgi:hypothetical protein